MFPKFYELILTNFGGDKNEYDKGVILFTLAF